MLTSQRIIQSDDGSLTDRSLELGDYRSGSVTPAYVATEDYLYVGCEYPFNHKYFDVGTVNAVSSAVSVDIWYSNGWVSAVDVLDGTKVAGASLAQDGIIRWTTNRLKGWDPAQDSADVTGLAGTAIYDFYWVRFKWSVSLTSGMTLLYLGNKFANDDQLFSFYPDLNNEDVLSQFEPGKTSWDEQHYIASDGMIADLKRRGVIFSQSQIFDYEILNEPAIHKAAEVIYGGMGKAFAENMASARDRYNKSISVDYFKIDSNADGHLDPAEKRFTTGWLSR